jgi:hypothetical protein
MASAAQTGSSSPKKKHLQTAGINMTTFDKEEEIISLSSKQMEQLRRELREHISREELGRAWQLEALDRIFMVSQLNPAAFYRLWIQPLLAAGLSLEEAIAHIVVSYFQPN